jgi:hypothetical protein
MNRSRRPRLVLVFAALALASACSTQRVGGSGPSQMAGVAPMLSVERFLQASNASDYESMARLFGNFEGPMADTGGGSCGLFGGRCASEREVEQRMAAIAEILRHDDYRIVSERQVAGHEHDANRIGVDITKGEDVVRDVAFVVVRSKEGAWLVESIDLEKVAGV